MEVRLINANDIVKVAERAYDAWNLAMATQDTNRGINKVFKMQELCKAVEAVAKDAPTFDPEELPLVKELREQLVKVTNQRNELSNLLNDICKDVREKHVDDSVCGLCEYDGACIGESGDWANECPGFDIDDCFCMKKSIKQEYGQKEVLEDEEKSAL